MELEISAIDISLHKMAEFGSHSLGQRGTPSHMHSTAMRVPIVRARMPHKACVEYAAFRHRALLCAFSGPRVGGKFRHIGQCFLERAWP
jgi:hypothetical protein